LTSWIFEKFWKSSKIYSKLMLDIVLKTLITFGNNMEESCVKRWAQNIKFCGQSN